MKSALPKALHRIAGRPMLQPPHRELRGGVRPRRRRGRPRDGGGGARRPRRTPSSCSRSGSGPAHAALQAEAHFGNGDVAVLYADNPLIRPETMRRAARGGGSGPGMALLAMRPAEPGRYGRVITEGDAVQRIVEWADASEAERATTLCNAGVLCAPAADFARWLHAVQPSPAKGEYLSDRLRRPGRGRGQARRRGRGAVGGAARHQLAGRAGRGGGDGAALAAAWPRWRAARR